MRRVPYDKLANYALRDGDLITPGRVLYQCYPHKCRLIQVTTPIVYESFYDLHPNLPRNVNENNTALPVLHYRSIADWYLKLKVFHDYWHASDAGLWNVEGVDYKNNSNYLLDPVGLRHMGITVGRESSVPWVSPYDDYDDYDAYYDDDPYGYNREAEESMLGRPLFPNEY